MKKLLLLTLLALGTSQVTYGADAAEAFDVKASFAYKQVTFYRLLDIDPNDPAYGPDTKVSARDFLKKVVLGAHSDRIGSYLIQQGVKLDTLSPQQRKFIEEYTQYVNGIYDSIRKGDTVYTLSSVLQIPALGVQTLDFIAAVQQRVKERARNGQPWDADAQARKDEQVDQLNARPAAARPAAARPAAARPAEESARPAAARPAAARPAAARPAAAQPATARPAAARPAAAEPESSRAKRIREKALAKSTRIDAELFLLDNNVPRKEMNEILQDWDKKHPQQTPPAAEEKPTEQSAQEAEAAAAQNAEQALGQIAGAMHACTRGIKMTMSQFEEVMQDHLSNLPPETFDRLRKALFEEYKVFIIAEDPRLVALQQQLKDQDTEARAALEKAETEAATLRKQVATLKKNSARAQAASEKAAGEAAKLKTKIATLKDNSAKAQTALKETETEAAELREQVATLKDNGAKAQTALEKAEGEAAELREQVATLQTKPETAEIGTQTEKTPPKVAPKRKKDTAEPQQFTDSSDAAAAAPAPEQTSHAAAAAAPEQTSTKDDQPKRRGKRRKFKEDHSGDGTQSSQFPDRVRLDGTISPSARS